MKNVLHKNLKYNKDFFENGIYADIVTGYIDDIKYIENNIFIIGWILYKNNNSDELSYSIPKKLFITLDKTPLAECSLEEARPDVVEYMQTKNVKDADKLLNCGFNISINLEKISIYRLIDIKVNIVVDSIIGTIGINNTYGIKGSVQHFPAKQIALNHFDYTYFPKKRYTDKFPHYEINKILKQNVHHFAKCIESFYTYIKFFDNINQTPDPYNPTAPYWNNPFFSYMDAISLYSFLVMKNPEIYCEVGSGYSTKFARKAIQDHNLSTKIISIDPFPRDEINEICDKIYREPLENINISIFENLPSSTILLIDNSHRSFQNSDVTISFLDILPKLNDGITVGFHDIFLPSDYPDEWIAERRFYNEQYLMATFLLGGHKNFEIILPNYYCYSGISESFELINSLYKFKKYNFQSTCFWLKSQK